MGTWTFTPNTSIPSNVMGTERVVYGTLTGSSSYATGGDSITPAAFGLDYVDFIDVSFIINSTTSGYIVEQASSSGNPTSSTVKLQVFGMNAAAGVGNAFTEITAATNLSTFSVIVQVFGV